MDNLLRIKIKGFKSIKELDLEHQVIILIIGNLQIKIEHFNIKSVTSVTCLLKRIVVIKKWAYELYIYIIHKS
jgi:hypothetical protein